MAELETAHDAGLRILRAAQPREFYEELCNRVAGEIEARDKAVALRVLDDFEARIREQFKRVDPAWRQLLPILLREARHKYQEKP